jgi:hypothetical protein
MGACPLRQVQRFALVPLVVDVGYVIAMLSIGYGGMLLRWIVRRGEKNDA